LPVIADPGSATFIAAKWINVPDGFIMPVDMNYNDGEAPVRLAVSTKTTLFKLEKRVPGNQLICNRRLSYFQTKRDNSLLKEIALNP
jgi:hypothetical protein